MSGEWGGGRRMDSSCPFSSCGCQEVQVHTCVRNAFKARFELSEPGLELSWEWAYLPSMKPRVWSCLPHLLSLPSRDESHPQPYRVRGQPRLHETLSQKQKPHLLASVPFGQEGGLVLNFCTASLDYLCCANAQELHVLCLSTKI